MISIKNFVNTDIEVLRNAVDDFDGFRTTVYFAGSGTIGTGNFLVVTSVDELINKIEPSSATAATLDSVQAYFDNGGTTLCFARPTGFDLEAFKSDLLAIQKELADAYFVVVAEQLVRESNGYSTAELARIATFASSMEWSPTDRKTYRTFRLCLTTNNQSFIEDRGFESTKTFVKYSTLTKETLLVDAALLVGAYFSRISIDEPDSIKDYHFTPEFLSSSDGFHFEDATQSEFEHLINSASTGHYNFIGKVANKIVNIGGDFCDGSSISLDFGVACIERDLDFVSIEQLFGKATLTQEGQSKLIASIKTALLQYVNNNFLESDSSYSGATEKFKYNGVMYTAVTNGDVMPLGYKLTYVPIGAIDAKDKAAKRFPYMFLALQSVHGARLIQINGSIV